MECSRYVQGAVVAGLICVSLVIYQYTSQHDTYVFTQNTDEHIQDSVIRTDKAGGAPSNQPIADHKGGNWTRPAEVPPYILQVEQEDNQLVEYITQAWLLPPSTLPLNLVNPKREHYCQMKQSVIVDKLLGMKRNGFYIESGAADGESLSNSLFFEKSRNWTGVLIEPDVEYFSQLVGKHRHSYLVNACLSPTRKAVTTSFRTGGLIGALANYMTAEHAKRMDNELGKTIDTVIVQCFPLYSILKAIGVSHVDFFSLDIEGAEPEVLRTLPMDKMTVDVFCIEHNGDAGKLAEIKDFLVGQHGYEITHQDGQDIYLKRKQMLS